VTDLTVSFVVQERSSPWLLMTARGSSAVRRDHRPSARSVGCLNDCQPERFCSGASTNPLRGHLAGARRNASGTASVLRESQCRCVVDPNIAIGADPGDRHLTTLSESLRLEHQQQP